MAEDSNKENSNSLEISTADLPDKCHSLRLRSIRKRIETERKCRRGGAESTKSSESSVSASNSSSSSSCHSAAAAPRRSGGGSRRRRSAPLSRYRRKTANARERDRMRHVNDAFERLKGSIPNHKLFSEVRKLKFIYFIPSQCCFQTNHFRSHSFI